MIFTGKTLTTLEYDKIIEMLADCTATEGAKAKARSLMPIDDYDFVVDRQRKTDDAKRLINAKGYPSFSAPDSVISSADRAYKGGILSPRELLDIASLLRSGRAMLDYIDTDKPFETTLDPIFKRIITNRPLEDRITRSIISEDLIADEASPELATIRRKIKAANNKIRDSLQKLVSSSNFSKYLQENIVTMRNGRYVVPVKVEYRSEIKGMVHDTSASGATVFIEPSGVVDANNELKVLEGKEQKEIDRIVNIASEIYQKLN